jgi:hypothetical protein
LKKGGTPPETEGILMKITQLDSAYPIVDVSSSHLQKCGIVLFFFCQKKDHGCVFIYFFGLFVFPSGDRMTPYSPWGKVCKS